MWPLGHLHQCPWGKFIAFTIITLSSVARPSKPHFFRISLILAAVASTSSSLSLVPAFSCFPFTFNHSSLTKPRTMERFSASHWTTRIFRRRLAQMTSSLISVSLWEEIWNFMSSTSRWLSFPSTSVAPWRNFCSRTFWQALGGFSTPYFVFCSRSVFTFSRTLYICFNIFIWFLIVVSSAMVFLCCSQLCSVS